jgi:hypothetical protein
MFWDEDETPEEYERRRLQDMMEVINRINFYALGQRVIEWREAHEKMTDRLSDDEEIDEAMREDIEELESDASTLAIDLSYLSDFIHHKMRPIEKTGLEYDKKHHPDWFDDE